MSTSVLNPENIRFFLPAPLMDSISLMATRKKKKLSSMSIFSEIESIKGAGKKNLIFSGFNTEVDIIKLFEKHKLNFGEH